MAQKFLTDIELTRGLKDSSGDLGSSGQVLSSTGTGLNWINSDQATSASVVYQDGFTGNGTTTAFTLANSIDNENKTQVYLDGVYQHKDTYSLSGTTLTFSTAPPNSSDIEVISFSSVSSADDILYDDDFTSAGLMTTNGSGSYSITTNNSSNWNTAYTYSQVGHLPLAGGTISGDLNVAGGDLRLDSTAKLFTNEDNMTISVEDNNNGTNANIIFKNAASTSLTLAKDLSATFTGTLTIPEYIVHSGDTDTFFGFVTNNEYKVTVGNSTKIFADANAAYLYYQGSQKIRTTNTGINVTGGATFAGDVTIGGTTGSTGNALAVNRGSDGAQALRVQNSGEVVIPSNYLYCNSSGVSMYVQNTAVFRGSIVNDGGNVTIGDDLVVTGDVGIGTTSPGAKLEIFGTGNTLRLDSAANQSKTILLRNVGSGTAEIKTDGDLKLNAEDSGKTIQFFTENTERMRITSSAEGHIELSGTAPVIKATASNGSSGLRINIASQSGGQLFRVQENGATLFQINDGGQVGIGNTSPSSYDASGDDLVVGSSGNSGITIVGGTTGASSLYFADGTSGGAQYTGFIDYLHSNNVLRFGTNNGAERMRIDSSGNLGIGTTSPGARLDVNGATYVRNVVYGYAGAGNQYGGLSWAGTDEGFLFLKDSNVTKVIINSNGNSYLNGGGNVGIGVVPEAVTAGNIRLDIGSIGCGITSRQNQELVITSNADYIKATTSNRNPIMINLQNDGNFNILNAPAVTAGSNLTFTSRFFIKTDGNVGIGMTSPEKKLSIGSSQSNGIQFTYDSTNNYRNQILNYWNSNTDSRMDFNIARTSGQTPETIMSVGYGGNVGIGVTSPNEKLQVAGSINAYAPSGIDAALFASTAAGSTTIAIRSNGITHFNGGKVGINETAPAAKLQVSGDRDGVSEYVAILGEDGGANGAANSANITPVHKTLLTGYSVPYSGQTNARLTSVGFLEFDSTPGWTGNQRNYALTNGYDMGGTGGPKFAILMGDSQNNDPQLGTNGSVGSGTGDGANTRVCSYWDNGGNMVVPEGSITVNQGIYIGGNVAANLLDDYEEGTFTPAIGDGTYTYSYRRGHYQKIGNTVHIHIGFKINQASSVGTGVARITGLPFAGMSWGSYQEPHERCGAAGLCVTANLSYNLSFYISNSSAQLNGRTTANNADTQVNSNQVWQNGTFIKLQLSYTVS